MTTTHWDRLEELRAEHRQRLAEHRDLEGKAREAQAAPGHASDALARAFANDAAAATVRKLEKALDEARASAAEPWNERIKGALLKAQAAQGAISSYAATNLDALMGEQEPLATDLHARQVAALQAVVDVEKERGQFVHKLSEIEKAAGRPPSIPDVQMPLYRDARLALQAGVPAVQWPQLNHRRAETEQADAGDATPLVQEASW